jgi:hypothetical protein
MPVQRTTGDKYAAIIGRDGKVYVNNHDLKVLHKGRVFSTGLKDDLSPLENWELEEPEGTIQEYQGGLGATPAVDLSASQYFPIIADQDGLGTCAAWSSVYYTIGLQAAQANGWTGAKTGNPAHLLNPLFVWTRENGGVDAGTGIDQGFNWMGEWGCPTQDIYPLSNTNFTDWGPEVVQRAAYLHRSSTAIDLASTVSSVVSDIKALLNQGIPVSFALDAAQYNNMGTDDIMTALEYNTTSYNHANTFVGYDDTVVSSSSPTEVGAFKVANQWGTGFAQSGFYWMTYACVQKIKNSGTIQTSYAQYVHGNPTYLAKVSYSPQMLRNVNLENQLVDSSGKVLVSHGVIYTPVYPTSGGVAYFPNPMVMDVSMLAQYSAYNSTDEFRHVLSSLVSGAVNGAIVGFEVESFKQPYNPNDTTYIVSTAPTGVPLSALGYVEAAMGTGGGGGGDTYYDTTLSAVISPSSISLGQTAVITGTLVTSTGVAVNGQTISFTVSNGDVISSAVTNASGAFSTSYTPSAVGTVTIIAHYAGSA